jgi:hypothetical protein
MGEAGYGSRVALSAGQTISSAPLRAPTSNAQCTNLPCSSRPPPAALDFLNGRDPGDPLPVFARGQDRTFGEVGSS